MLYDSASMTEWHLKKHKNIKLSSRVADGENFFSLSKLNCCIATGLKAMR